MNRNNYPPDWPQVRPTDEVGRGLKLILVREYLMLQFEFALLMKWGVD